MKHQYSDEYINKTSEEIVLKICEAAKYYESNLAGKNFLITSKGRVWELECNRYNFKHLCGVGSKLNKYEFYDNALQGTLNTEDIFFDKRYPFKYAKEKARVILNVFKAFKESSHLLTDIVVEKRDVPFQAGLNLQIEDGGTLCFGLDSHKKLVPISLRANTEHVDHYKGDYLIDYIFSKRFREKEYTNLEYGDLNTLDEYLNKRNLLDLSINKNSIKESVNMYNNHDSKIELEVQNKEKSIKFTARNIDAKTLGDFIKSSNIIDKVLEDEKSAENFSRD